MKRFLALGFTTLLLLAPLAARAQSLAPTALRTEYLVAPDNIDSPTPRLSWRVESARRGAAQTAWQVRVASSAAKLAAGEADLWDSGRVAGEAGNATNQIAYAGRALASRGECFWQVKVLGRGGRGLRVERAGALVDGLLQAGDWRAEWISYRDDEPLHADRKTLHLPAPRHYRKEFSAAKTVRRAVVYASALGIYDLYCNGKRVGDDSSSPVGRTICFALTIAATT